MHRPTLAASLTPCVALFLALTARADLINIVAARDNTLYEDPLGALSNGAGPSVFCGETASAKARRALLYFDIAAAIPAGATIDSVSLRLQLTKTRSGASPIDLHTVLANWGEGTSTSSPGGAGADATPGDATWIDRFYGQSQTWTTPGGDFDPAILSTTSVAGLGSYTWPSTPALVTQVQSWLASPSANFGLLLQGDEATLQDAKRFASRESTTPAYRPTLIVNYTVPAPGAALLLAAAAPLLTRRRRH